MKGKRGGFVDMEDVEVDESDDEDDIKYSCIFIDDFADIFKNNDIQLQLNKMLIKARHICYTYYPAIILLLSKNIEKTNYQCNHI